MKKTIMITYNLEKWSQEMTTVIPLITKLCIISSLPIQFHTEYYSWFLIKKLLLESSQILMSEHLFCLAREDVWTDVQFCHTLSKSSLTAYLKIKELLHFQAFVCLCDIIT